MTEENTEGIDAKFDWESSFFRQCERIDSSTTISELKKNIDLLECKLHPYKDSDYEKAKDDAYAMLKDDARRYGRSGVPQNKAVELAWNVLKAKYSSLMELAYRQKVLPQHNIPQKEI